MERISIVPDTNLLISHLNFIKYILNIDGPFYITIYIPRVVLGELDLLKTTHFEVREIIRFISDNLNRAVEIEGHINTDKIEVEVFKKEYEKITEQNNDDKILNYINTLENPILLTNDVVLQLKCNSYNIPSFGLNDKNYLDTFNLILKTQGIQINLEQKTEKYIQFEKIFYEITQKIKIIIINELGTDYILTIHENNFSGVLDLVIDNFNIFNRYFPKYSKQYFIKLKKAIENYEIDNIHKYLKIIAAISGIVYTITNN